MGPSGYRRDVPTSTRIPGRSGGVDLDAGHLVPGQEFAHHQRDEAAAVVQLALQPGPLVVGQRDDAGERVERGGDVGGLLHHQQGAPVQLVAADHGAEPVHDAAARRRDQPGADAVALGQGRVAHALDHLHLVQLGGQHAHDADLACPQDQGAPGEHAVGAGFLLHAWSGSARPRCAAGEQGGDQGIHPGA